MAVQDCAIGIFNPERTQGLIVAPAFGPHVLVTLKGPGIFIAAEVSKQGGVSGITFVNLNIDGRNVVSTSYAAVENLGMTQQNPFGIVLCKSAALKNMTIGFPIPLRYQRDLILSVDVGPSDAGVAQIVANVIHGN